MILFIGHGSEWQYIFKKYNTPFPECYDCQKLFLCCNYSPQKRDREGEGGGEDTQKTYAIIVKDLLKE